MSGAVKLVGLEQFDATVKGWLADAARAAQQAAAGLAKKALSEMARNSPQSTSDFVRNWRVSHGAPDTGYRNWGGKRGEYEQGDADGVAAATLNATAALVAAGNAKLGTPIFISNNSKHDEEYAWKIEDGSINFRPENLKRSPSKLTKQGVAFAVRRYSKIGKVELAILRQVGV